MGRKAIEWLKEANHEKTRTETMGPIGCMECSLAGTDKTFLMNTIKNTLPCHKGQDHEPIEGNKEHGKSQNWKEENQKHRAHPYKQSFQAPGTVYHSPPRKQSSQDNYEERSNKL